MGRLHSSGKQYVLVVDGRVVLAPCRWLYQGETKYYSLADISYILEKTTVEVENILRLNNPSTIHEIKNPDGKYVPEEVFLDWFSRSKAWSLKLLKKFRKDL